MIQTRKLRLVPSYKWLWRRLSGCSSFAYVAFFAVVISLTIFSNPVISAEPKNVLLLCVDDLRNVMGCYGGAAKTPHLDRLAKTAAVFNRHYIQWPVCGPSSASMLGGLRPDTTGIYEIGDSWKISKRPDTHPTLPRYFRDHGYRTLSFGKIYHQKGTSAQGTGGAKNRGSSIGPATLISNTPTGRKASGVPPSRFTMAPTPCTPITRPPPKSSKPSSRTRIEPFFIAGGFFKPHLPFVAPQKYWDLYSDEETKLIAPYARAEGAADFMYSFAEISSYGVERGKLFSDDSDVGRKSKRRMIHAYYACVSFIDAQIGRILEALETSGLAETTAVVIWSDHGFHLGDHDRWAKHTQFEHVMRCPLIVRLPGKQKVTGLTDAIVESVDLYPSLCEFAGLPVPSFVEGESLLPILAGKSNGKEAAFSQIRPVNRKKRDLMAYSVRTDNYRYVEWREPSNNNAIVWRELYDHRNDPAEAVNVIEHPKHSKAIRGLERLVLSNYQSLKQ